MPESRRVGQSVSPIERARQRCQDHGAKRFIRSSADAGVLGDCGLEAVRVVLEHLARDPDGWLTVEGANHVEQLWNEAIDA